MTQNSVYEPEYILDPARYDEGFIWIPGWEKFQHRDATKGGLVHLKWHKLLTKSLDNDRYRDLPMGARGLVVDLRMLVARTHNGYPRAQVRDLRGQLGVHSKHLQGTRDLVIQAGFVAVVARQCPAEVWTPASLDEIRLEENKKKAREAAAMNGGSRAERKNKTAPRGDDGLPIMPYDEWLALQASTKEMP